MGQTVSQIPEQDLRKEWSRYDPSPENQDVIPTHRFRDYLDRLRLAHGARRPLSDAFVNLCLTEIDPHETGSVLWGDFIEVYRLFAKHSFSMVGAAPEPQGLGLASEFVRHSEMAKDLSSSNRHALPFGHQPYTAHHSQIHQPADEALEFRVPPPKMGYLSQPQLPGEVYVEQDRLAPFRRFIAETEQALGQIRLKLDDPIDNPSATPCEGNLTYAVDLGESLASDLRYCEQKTGERGLPMTEKPYVFYSCSNWFQFFKQSFIVYS